MDESTAALSAAERAAVRELVESRRERTADQIADLSRAFDDIVDAARSTATDDEHDPEGSTIAFERSQVATLLRQARDQLAELDHALDRLADGTFGRCESCGRAIPMERLTARPSTTTCVACAGRGRRR
ncbi:TraR/DksA family transcriptional regulator [Actinopolymorpha pittospori]|uniref:RNA polymerase-binding transcription factor DksA n=1 Tax=Actinopolymorpha pittospori TaxID=648752 RepID=A0A927MU70_9ACTN|nr:TraR/DksA C4-type zinc finger protein [Actinopolymorpha pittospori]MBE1606714.1 RNA polymerase-binding transcription factor DksA [Actinopolymorpha pittospori]